MTETPALPRSLPHGVALSSRAAQHGSILTEEALAFLARLHRRFEGRRQELLTARLRRQARLDAGERPDFLSHTARVRAGDWKVAPVPHDLRDRRVEITGPVDRKMVINALNAGANVYMADFEDSSAPSWDNLLDGQRNLYDAIRRQIDFVHPETGKEYRLAERTATLVVRPRGWHLPETHLSVDGQAVSGALFDFGLYLFHNAHELLARGTGPYFYLPKLQSHLEARLWNDVFCWAQDELGIERGTIKATVLIEHVLAAFEMDEILYELRAHSAGLNCGRWDYIFSFIKTLRADPGAVLPDRATVGMDRRFLRSYSLLLIQTCHRRGAHAMGGMAAQIPIKGDEARNVAAIDKVRADKDREANDGHDGTWVAHPGLVSVAREIFDELMVGPHQLERLRPDVEIRAEDLLAVPRGSITQAGLRQNLDVGLQYTAAWLCGKGCVPLYDLMEDAATAEISRAQVWQWLHHGARLEDGRAVDAALVRTTLDEVEAQLRERLGDQAYDAGRFALARELTERLITAPELEEFLTLYAYGHLDSIAA